MALSQDRGGLSLYFLNLLECSVGSLPARVPIWGALVDRTTGLLSGLSHPQGSIIHVPFSLLVRKYRRQIWQWRLAVLWIFYSSDSSHASFRPRVSTSASPAKGKPD